MEQQAQQEPRVVMGRFGLPIQAKWVASYDRYLAKIDAEKLAAASAVTK